MTIYDRDDDDLSRVPGFFLRCSVVDSLLRSSLQCLYSQACLDYLVHYLSIINIYAQNVPLLNATSLARFTENSTVAEMVDQSFVDEWIQIASHLKYFETCAPSTCTLTYVGRPSLFYTLMRVIAIFGGLSFILRFLSPLVMALIISCYHRQENRANANPGRSRLPSKTDAYFVLTN